MINFEYSRATDVADEMHTVTDGDALAAQFAGAHSRHLDAIDEHRVATTVDGVEVDDIAATGKTLPGFVALWSMLVGA